jgi:DNA-3-methyladenine glycosylase II
MTPGYWNDAKKYLSKNDPVMRAVIRAYQGEAMHLRGKGFQTLARAIVGQQISVKAADSIWRKFVVAVGGKVTPERVANAAAETLRPCGLSAAKVIYLHALANHFLENGKSIKRWPQMEDEAIIRELVSIKGIGRWTAEMFLIFHLARPDVFPIADLGLLKGIYRLYNKNEEMPRAQVMRLAERWRPWRSVATWYLWRSLDPVAVEY